MKQLHRKIEERKRSINEKKDHLGSDYEAAKGRLTSVKGLSLTSIGGFVLGFLLLPKKFRIIRSVFKAYTMVATFRGFLDLIPQKDQPSSKEREKH